MRRALAALLVLALHSAPQAAQDQSSQDRPTQADGIVRLLADLEAALADNRPAAFRELVASTAPVPDTSRFEASLFGPGQTIASVRERDRRPEPGGDQVLAEILVGRGRSGWLSTWQFTVRPRPDGSGRYEITELSSIATVDGLVKISLDPTRQFVLDDFTFAAPDFELRFDSGTAFVAEVDGGITALVLLGRGEVRFAPPDPAEQGQLRIFAGRPVYESEVRSAFIRVNPANLTARIGASALVPAREVDPDAVENARELFDRLSQRSYTLDLGDLTSERWSLLPPAGDALVEIDTRRHGTLTYVQSTSDAEDISFFDRERRRNLSVYTSAERLAERGRFYSDDEHAPVDVLHYSVDAHFDPDREWISARGTVRARVRAAGITTLSLRLSSALAVSQVVSPTFGRLLALRVSGQNSLIVALPTTVPRGAELTVEVRYQGRLASQDLDREAVAPTADAQVNVQDPADLILLKPEPRYIYSNRSYWYPHTPVSDFATADLQLTVPARYQVVASGTLQSSVVQPGPGNPEGGDESATRVSRFVADRPARYFSCVISRFVPAGRVQVEVPAVAPGAGERGAPDRGLTPRAIAREVRPHVNVDIVATPRQSGRGRSATERVTDILGFYAGLVGEAPYPDFTVAAMDALLPGGHSPAYFAIWNQQLPTSPFVWHNDPVAFDNVFPSYFLAHEVAHQWWGQAIGWKNYHEQWISEGFAQYFAALYAGHERGPETQRDLFKQMADSARSLSAQGPIYLGYRLGHIRQDSRAFRAIVYNKSAVVLDMLRRFVGDEVFLAGMRRFYREFRFEKAGTDDFRQALEAEGAPPLERFFDRWVLGATIPEVHIDWRAEAGGQSAVVELEQEGPDVFDMPVTLTIQYRDGPDQQVTIRLTEAKQQVSLPIRGPVRRIDARDDLGLARFRS